jgi:hypothetical protein
MTEHAKIAASHLARQAIVYLRQSSPSQVEHNRESTNRQYALAIKARELGWSDDRIVIIDEILAFLVRARSSAQGLLALPLRWRSAMSASCSVLKYLASRATTPTGIASSILPALAIR